MKIPAILNEIRTICDRLDPEPVRALAQALADSPAVFVAGAGRSGLIARCFAMRLMHLGLNARCAGDTLAPPLRAGDLLVVISASGETAGVAAVAGKAKKLGAVMALITAAPNSSLAALADLAVVLDAPAIGSRQPLGSLFEQGAFLLCEALVLELLDRLGQSGADLARRHANLE